eukprot:m.1637953 g.1637953  ORF g.1637953 m.1637953 type:complete len:382 (-) comp26472_c0_seq1:273-1418(-)
MRAPVPTCFSDFLRVIFAWKQICTMKQTNVQSSVTHDNFVVKLVLFIGVVLSFDVVTAQGATDTCPATWIADGYCDPGCNDALHSWDGGDCCEDTCVDAAYDCGVNGFDCKSISSDKYVYVKQYAGYTITLQCDKKAKAGYAIGYAYNLTRDREDLGSKRRYENDATVPSECQQQFRGNSMPSYKHPRCGQSGRQSNPFCFDRGHIVMANHLDGTSQTRRDASYVTNLVPQASGFNQNGGAWKETEDIIECHRDYPNVERLEIFGGLIYDNVDNDYFWGSHGIPTVDVYYKVVVKYFKSGSTPDVIAWIMKNEHTDRSHRLDALYPNGDLVSTKRLKRLANDPLERLPGIFTESAYAAGDSWDRASDCSRGNLASPHFGEM